MEREWIKQTLWAELSQLRNIETFHFSLILWITLCISIHNEPLFLYFFFLFCLLRTHLFWQWKRTNQSEGHIESSIQAREFTMPSTSLWQWIHYELAEFNVKNPIPYRIWKWVYSIQRMKREKIETKKYGIHSGYGQIGGMILIWACIEFKSLFFESMENMALK